MRVAKGSQTARPCPDHMAPQTRSWDDDKKWLEMGDENTVGTFTNLGFEADRTGKSCLPGKRAKGFPDTTVAWIGPNDLPCLGQVYILGRGAYVAAC